MSFDWSSYLTLAEYMNTKAGESPNQEACYRSVVSRAYYAAFCLTRNYVRDSEGVAFGGNDHRALQDYLISRPHKPKKKLGNQLRILHQHRIKADYEDKLDELPVNKASRSLIQARKIVNGLEQLRGLEP